MVCIRITIVYKKVLSGGWVLELKQARQPRAEAALRSSSSGLQVSRESNETFVSMLFTILCPWQNRSVARKGKTRAARGART